VLIFNYVPFHDYSGVSKASERLREEMASDKKLVNLLNEVMSQFKT